MPESTLSKLAAVALFACAKVRKVLERAKGNRVMIEQTKAGVARDGSSRDSEMLLSASCQSHLG
jgi:hypothetical protein